MGLVYADIKLTSCDDIAVHERGYISEDEIRSKNVTALVDSGAYMLCINEHIKTQLGLRVIDEMEAELANGTIEKVDVVGPVEINFKNRSTSCRAAVMPGESEVLLGAIPMEDMDVIVLPKEQKLIVNPNNPYLAKKKIKEFTP